MATSTPSTQSADTQPLTKPADWSIHMVTAALKFSSANDTPPTYTTADAARLDVLDTLNWFEAHGEYGWPDFFTTGFDFSQAMRFRRALVNDVFLALQKAGHVKLSSGAGLGTPESAGKGVKRSGAERSSRMAERRRQCKREDESETDIVTDHRDKPPLEDEKFLAKTMRLLLTVSDTDITMICNRICNGQKDAKTLAAAVHENISGRDSDSQASGGFIYHLALFEGIE